MSLARKKLLIATHHRLELWIAPEWFADRLRKEFTEFEVVRIANDAVVKELPDTEIVFTFSLSPEQLGIARKLRRHGATLISEPQSFFVTKFSQLSPNKEMRARDWGAQLGRTLDETAPRPSTPTR